MGSFINYCMCILKIRTIFLRLKSKKEFNAGSFNSLANLRQSSSNCTKPILHNTHTLARFTNQPDARLARLHSAFFNC